MYQLGVHVNRETNAQTKLILLQTKTKSKISFHILGFACNCTDSGCSGLSVKNLKGHVSFHKGMQNKHSEVLIGNPNISQISD